MSDPALTEALEATWPAAEYRDAGGFRVGRGMGGGKRLSSARALGDWSADGIDAAAAVHREWDQPALFRVESGETALGAALAARGYAPRAQALMLQAPVDSLLDRPIPPITAIPAWPPLAVQRDIWTSGDVGEARIAAMERVTDPKQAILARVNDRAIGAGFMAVHGDIAMLHALFIAPTARRHGAADWITRRAAFLAAEEGARLLTLAVAADNAPALTLYRKLGFTEVGASDYWS